jgi:hypothetical protein
LGGFYQCFLIFKKIKLGAYKKKYLIKKKKPRQDVHDPFKNSSIGMIKLDKRIQHKNDKNAQGYRGVTFFMNGHSVWQMKY